MKKTNLIMASALLVGLCGCTDAQAKLKDSSTAVMAVGSQNITKGEIYTVLSSAYGANAVINDAVSRICAAEVEVTDEMRTEAEGSLESMKALYGDSFLNYLESSGMSEEDYLNEVILPGQQFFAVVLLQQGQQGFIGPLAAVAFAEGGQQAGAAKP